MSCTPRRRAAALADLLIPNGELLPIYCGGEKLFLYNVTRVIDALDELNSEIDEYEGVLTAIDEYCFFPERLANEVVFKIPQDVTGDTYVTDIFLERVRKAGLRGFDFPIVWSDEYELE